MSGHESTPLLGRSSSQSSTRRYANPVRIAILLATFCGIAAILGLFLGHGKGHEHDSPTLSLEELRSVMKTTPEASAIHRSNAYYCSGPHLAGQNLSQVLWTQELWASYGIRSEIKPYDVYLNRPINHSLTLQAEHKNGKHSSLFKASLEELPFAEDPASSDPRRIPTFHAYSASGDVTARFVFANYGSYDDFEDLLRANITVEGKIVVMKYETILRGMKVKRAEQLGAIGAILYSDPGDDEFRESDGYEPYPYGYARQPSSVQRGSTMLWNWQPGDPSTPGYASTAGAARVNADDMVAISKIPSLPISFADAVPILKSLNGHGPRASTLGPRWATGGLEYQGVQYSVGPSPANLKLHLINNQNYTTTTIHNLIGVINSTSSDEVVVMGNHHDSWTVGGAADPHSGSAALNEIVHSFGKALSKGWRPRRTIIFASWDGEEYGMLGSTEWVEEHLDWLSEHTVTYLNSDPGVSGDEFFARSVPLLDHMLYRNAEAVTSPRSSHSNRTIRDDWDGEIQTVGSGSDYVAFLGHTGISVMDIGFSTSERAATYHYHSNYDSIAWLDRFGDPGSGTQVVLAQLWGLIAADLVESTILPFNVTNYAVAIQAYISDLEKLSEFENLGASGPYLSDELLQASKRFLEAAQTFDKSVARVQYAVTANTQSVDATAENVQAINRKLMGLERQFLLKDGLDGRSWFKHTVFAPGLWTGYSGVTLPGLRETIQAHDEPGIARWNNIMVAVLLSATAWLDD